MRNTAPLIVGRVGADYWRTKYESTKAVLAERERELLELKGPCSTCPLHYAHSGPCAPKEADHG